MPSWWSSAEAAAGMILGFSAVTHSDRELSVDSVLSCCTQNTTLDPAGDAFWLLSPL